MKTVVLLLAMLLAATACLGDSPAPPHAHVVASLRGRAYFKMIPKTSVPGLMDGYGIAYRVRHDGAEEELWRTDGWFSFSVFLSMDGSSLVALGPWNEGHEPSKDHLAVAFYVNGRLVKRYSTAELVRDKSKVRTSVSHYEWLAPVHSERRGRKSDPEAEPRMTWEDTFRLKTCDGILYEFDVISGEILFKRR